MKKFHNNMNFHASGNDQRPKFSQNTHFDKSLGIYCLNLTQTTLLKYPDKMIKI